MEEAKNTDTKGEEVMAMDVVESREDVVDTAAKVICGEALPNSKNGEQHEGKKHYEKTAESTVGDVIQGSAKIEEGAPERRHFPDAAEATSKEEVVKSSIKLVEKPADHGDIVTGEAEGTENERPSKRIFVEKSEETEESPQKKMRKTIPDAANKKDRVLESTDDSEEPPTKLSRKMIPDAANKQDHLLTETSNDSAEKERKHFDPPTDNVKSLLADNNTNDNQDQPAKSDSDRPAGLTSVDLNRPRTVQPPIKSITKETDRPAGVSSTELNEAANGHADCSAQTTAAKNSAMAGTAMADSLTWTEPASS